MNAAPASLASLSSLLAELGDLKRMRHAAAPDSLATSLFRRAWAALVAGNDADTVALATAAAALVASCLGGIDAALLARCGLDDSARETILRRAFDAASQPLDARLSAAVRQHIATNGDATNSGASAEIPHFVDALAHQPRAGATCPGKSRLMLEPPESHADHCLAVAVYAVLIAPRYDAPLGDAFLLGLAHHLHNAVLPDAGYAGEVLLGDALEPIVERLNSEAIATLPAELARRIRTLRPLLAAADAPAARAFHAADVIDRVLQMRQYARVAAFEIGQALDDLELVHAGPVQAFHLATLREAELP